MLDLQVPAAAGGGGQDNNVYVSSDRQFTDPVRRVKISNGVNLFHLGSGATATQNAGFDRHSGRYMLNVRLNPGTTWPYALPGNARRQTAPFSGYRSYRYQVTRDGFADGLAALRKANPSANISTDPKDYVLTMFHLNAELHCRAGHSELGWSMRNLQVSVGRTAP